MRTYLVTALLSVALAVLAALVLLACGIKLPAPGSDGWWCAFAEGFGMYLVGRWSERADRFRAAAPSKGETKHG